MYYCFIIKKKKPITLIFVNKISDFVYLLLVDNITVIKIDSTLLKYLFKRTLKHNNIIFDWFTIFIALNPSNDNLFISVMF